MIHEESRAGEKPATVIPGAYASRRQADVHGKAEYSFQSPSRPLPSRSRGCGVWRGDRDAAAICDLRTGISRAENEAGRCATGVGAGFLPGGGEVSISLLCGCWECEFGSGSSYGGRCRVRPGLAEESEVGVHDGGVVCRRLGVILKSKRLYIVDWISNIICELVSNTMPMGI